MTEKPITLHGIGVSPGQAHGRAVVLTTDVVTAPADAPCAEPDRELARLATAIDNVADELQQRTDASSGSAAQVLGATALMARDPALQGKVEEAVRRRSRTAERAVWEATEEFGAALSAGGEYFAERVRDVRDIRDRLLAELRGTPRQALPVLDEPAILIAADLAPADTASLDVDKVMAFATVEGGPTSHTAILARSLGIPAVVGCAGLDQVRTGTALRLDRETGEVRLGGTVPAGGAGVLRRQVRRLRYGGRLADGKPVRLCANVGEPAGVSTAAETGARDVGLLRTEFLFDQRTDPPSLAEQTEVYAQLFGQFPHGRVVVRTLDAGADKPLPFLRQEAEPNPALGVRGLRVARREPALLDIQLEAISRARSEQRAEVWAMAPMVATAAEARWFAQRARSHGLDVVGVMIEVPAAAVHAERILAEVDFVSIGTNDLAQYTFAADRMSGALAEFNDPWQPTLLELLRAVGSAGRRLGKPVGVCGEAAADPLLAPVLVGLGVTSLSMTARALPAVAERLGQLDRFRCEGLAKVALAAETAAAARHAVQEALAAG
ncbi:MULTISPECIES: phosphoenolpyruvate--protein phosphotransferase [Streptomyces]|uniref:phosphoenolpyruvate--protein phosphotransferase n=1 Tax=Streptomyces lycopersici TaxID=2974589 RepID=UPI0021CF8474|nr:phosphoenolpyruvate--protein phosphotransferase [Streptomyces sp. NEAU-383]